MTNEVLNVAAYKFVALDDLPALREALISRAQGLGVRGTILLAPEGINFSLAGDPASIETLLREFERDPRFAGLPVKRSHSKEMPFRRLRVKCKREIVALKRPDIRPDRTPAPRITPAELRRWLDAGRPVVLLDTRNQFEVDLGTFRGAHSLAIGSFSALPDALARADPAWREQTVVTFCTGGIRCEKAAPLIAQAGFGDVRQLDGGILAWFESEGSAHFEGRCFVFDERVSLDAALDPKGE